MAEVHRDRMPQTVHYTTAMPDLEALMQEWPSEVEAALSKLQLPSADLDVSLPQYTDIVCGRTTRNVVVRDALLSCVYCMYGLRLGLAQADRSPPVPLSDI